MNSQKLWTRRKVIGCGLAAWFAAEEPALHGVSALVEGGGLVRIPAGEFDMGSPNAYADERPVHRVAITRDFEIGKYEVTQAQWEAVMSDAHVRPGARPDPSPTEISTAPSSFKGPGLPVENVSWNEVQVFLGRLSERSETHRFRLPTEAEWEYAASGAAAPGARALPERAWFALNSGERTHTVGTKYPSPPELFDMDGNVSEWVSDWYAPDFYETGPHDDPRGPLDGSHRVFRGGCWSDDEPGCRITRRRFDFPVNRFHNVGFRVVREPK